MLRLVGMEQASNLPIEFPGVQDCMRGKGSPFGDAIALGPCRGLAGFSEVGKGFEATLGTGFFPVHAAQPSFCRMHL